MVNHIYQFDDAGWVAEEAQPPAARQKSSVKINALELGSYIAIEYQKIWKKKISNKFFLKKKI